MSAAKNDVYVEGIGRRKTATARVRLTPAKETSITVNGKKVEDFFSHDSLLKSIQSVLDTPDAGIENYAVSAHVNGGGTTAQAESIRLGIARALVKEKGNGVAHSSYLDSLSEIHDQLNERNLV